MRRAGGSRPRLAPGGSPLPITFPCDCGQPLVVEDRHVGVAVRCPKCRRTPTVPEPIPDAIPVGEDEAPPPPRPKPAAKPWKKGAAAEEPEPEPPADPNNPFGFTTPGESARTRERQVREREAREGGDPLEGGVTNNWTVNGLVALAAGAGLLAFGLTGDWISIQLVIVALVALFYGLVSLVAGLTGRK